ncbi:MAG: DUF418 domain-containing protein [Trueperaceae bacterium]|nr:DUF418 domain-containing protein [Trueperaceae bacterium]
MTPPTTATTPGRPVRGRDRLMHVDALRGVALFGILIVNLLAFSGPSFLYAEPLTWWSGADRWLEWGVLVLAEGAFYTIFSVLFGWGFGRWIRDRGDDATPRFARRLGWLLVIGAVHLFGVWVGDILTQYALIGFVLLPFATVRARGLALAGAGSWVVGVLLFLGATSGGDPASSSPHPWVELYQNGGFGQILGARLEQGVDVVASAVAYLPSVLGLFLIGAALAKSRAFERAGASEDVRRAWRRGVAVALPVGLALKAIYASRLLGEGETFRLVLSTSLGGPVLGFAYLGLATLAFTAPRRPGWAVGIERALAAAGRMALTVYLSQSIVMTLLFYGYGLGLYGRVGPTVGLPIALGLFAVQVVAARWWLQRFRFGPAEWAWRSLTYGTAQPWRSDRDGNGT